jgi:competence ComEA-like helix-hairpin-helix protein
MPNTPLVKINFDSAERIASLYAIGLSRARKIIQHRESVGPFRSPEDLAQVDGIGLDLAITLAPHIDWDVPSAEEGPVQKDWGTFIASGIAILFFLPLIRYQYYNLTYSLYEHNSGVRYAWAEALSTGALIGCFVLTIFSLIFLMFQAATDNAVRKRQYANRAIFMGGMVLLSALLMGLSILIRYQFYDRAGWAVYWGDPARFAGLLSFIVLTLFFSPLLLVILKPSLQSSYMLARVFDICTVIAAPLFAFAIWAERDWLPKVNLIALGVAGVFLGLIGFQVLRTGESMFSTIIEDLIDKETLRKIAAGTKNWQTWINARLPDEDEQKELKKALEARYPPSRWRTLGGAIVLGAGSWILLTALSAVLQWFVEKGMNTLFP